MKSALIAFTVVIGLGVNELRAITPYDDMVSIRDSLVGAGESARMTKITQLLTLATAGVTEVTDPLNATFNISEVRASADEKATNLHAIVTAARFLPKSGVPAALQMFKSQLSRTNLQDYEHDHILMVYSVFQAATNYFGALTGSHQAIDDLLLKSDVSKFRTGCIQSPGELVVFLNDFTDLTAAHPFRTASLPAIFEAVENEFKGLTNTNTLSSGTGNTPDDRATVMNPGAMLLQDGGPAAGGAMHMSIMTLALDPAAGPATVGFVAVTVKAPPKDPVAVSGTPSLSVDSEKPAPNVPVLAVSAAPSVDQSASGAAAAPGTINPSAALAHPPQSFSGTAGAPPLSLQTPPGGAAADTTSATATTPTAKQGFLSRITGGLLG